jgi:hypothetical protein
METIPLSIFFESPETWEGQEITLRGFLYQKDEKTVLALEPNIPSCCLGKENKPFITLYGEFPPLPSRAALVEGRIGKESSGWAMESAHFIEEQFYLKETLFFLALLFFLFCVFCKFWKALKIYFRDGPR